MVKFMNNIVFICTFISTLLIILLLALVVFAMGYFIGYKYEEKKIQQRTAQKNDAEIKESEDEKKAKREWKNFLKYDGGTIAERK